MLLTMGVETETSTLHGGHGREEAKQVKSRRGQRMTPETSLLAVDKALLDAGCTCPTSTLTHSTMVAARTTTVPGVAGLTMAAERGRGLPR